MSYGWSDQEYKDIIDTVLSKRGEYLAIDISSPPGTRKTMNILRYAVDNALKVIATFPNHVNQEQALTYILARLEETGAKELRFFVLDYAGVENYCIFYDPDALARLLDRFRGEGETYREAVDELLGHHAVFSTALGAGDEIWYAVAEALDEYRRSGDRERYLRRIKEIVAKYGQNELCKVCPVYAFYNLYRNGVRQALSKPKIITWRREFYKRARREYPTVAGNLVLADPRSLPDRFDDLSSGKLVLEPVLCPRLLLSRQATVSKKGKPTFITVRRSIILVPHAGLEYVVRTTRKQNRIVGAKEHALFVDEYDALLRPARWRLFPLSSLDALSSLTESVIDAGVGGYVGQVLVDEYMYALAEYLRDVSTEVKRIVVESIDSASYHPLVNLFYEGAFAAFDEKTLRTATPVHYGPLSPRPVHIKYFAGSDVLPKILNPGPYLEHLRVDPDWRLNVKLALSYLRELARAELLAPRPATVPGPGGAELRLVPRRVRLNLLDVVKGLRSMLAPLMERPVYFIFFTLEDGDVSAASLDATLIKLIRTRGIFVSATPVPWHLVTRGIRAGWGSIYAQAASDSQLSSIRVTPVEAREYSNRRERVYAVTFKDYSRDYLSELHAAVEAGLPIPPPRLVAREEKLLQIDMITEQVVRYAENLRIVYAPLPPLEPNPRDAVKEYIRVLAMIRQSVRGFVLVFVQNKEVARMLSTILRGVPCRRDVCGSDVKKVTHYTTASRVDITWFRSRAERGIDLPHVYSAMQVVGSPYPRPTYVADAALPTEQGLTTMVFGKTVYRVTAVNTAEEKRVTVTHTPLDIFNGIASLAQSVGRAARSAMQSQSPALVVLPAFLRTKVSLYAPLWMHPST